MLWIEFLRPILFLDPPSLLVSNREERQIWERISGRGDGSGNLTGLTSKLVFVLNVVLVVRSEGRLCLNWVLHQNQSAHIFTLPTGGTGKIWLKDKDEQLIIPQGLRERDFKIMPSRELKKPGPVFGTNAGKNGFLRCINE